MGDGNLCVSISKCPVHSNFYSISIDDDGGGTRLTPSKCCGRWRDIKSWVLTPQMCRDFIEEFSNALEGMEEKNNG